MKTLYLSFVLAALCLVASASFVSARQCPSCVVQSYVDIPAANAQPTVGSYQPWGVAGWGFLCESGIATHRVDLFYRGDDGYDHPIAYAALTNYWDINRPDVVTAFVGTCPNVYGHWTGYTVQIAGGAVPPGTRLITVNVWVEPYFHTEYRTLTFQ